MLNLADTARNADWLQLLSGVVFKHQPGRHDQHKHTPKAYLGASADIVALADPNSKINQDAIENWKNLSHEERMALGNPDAINLRMGQQLDRFRTEYDAPHDLTGKDLTTKVYSQVADNAHAHIDSMKDALNPTTEAKLREYVDAYMKDAVAQSIDEGSLKIDAGEMDSLMRRNIDKLTFQEIESRKRQLGDHGIRHVVGNMQATNMMLNDTDLGPVSGMDKLMALQTHVDHDMGYTAGVATKSFDATKYHKQYSEQYAKSEGYDKVFGDRTSEMHNWVGTHSDTGLDWQKQPVLSAIRTADNTALFSKEKYPALFNDVPGATDELYKLQLSQVAGTASDTLPGVKSNLRNLVDKSDLDPRQKADLNMAVDEVSPQTGKFTLGMAAGELQGYDHKDGTMHIKVKGKPEKEALDGMFDLGQKQFDKLVNDYDLEGSPSTGWKLKDPAGKSILQIDYEEAKAPASGSLGRLYNSSVRPDIKQASRATGTTSTRSGREQIWPAIEANVKAKLTSSELAEFERRFKAGTLDAMPLTTSEKEFMTEEVVKMLKMLLGEEDVLKHLPGRHDQQRHAPHSGSVPKVSGSYDPDPRVRRVSSNYAGGGSYTEVDAAVRIPVKYFNEELELHTFASCEGHEEDWGSNAGRLGYYYDDDGELIGSPFQSSYIGVRSSNYLGGKLYGYLKGKGFSEGSSERKQGNITKKQLYKNSADGKTHLVYDYESDGTLAFRVGTGVIDMSKAETFEFAGSTLKNASSSYDSQLALPQADWDSSRDANWEHYMELLSEFE